jgi:uracil-DNA glycosylase family 4
VRWRGGAEPLTTAAHLAELNARLVACRRCPRLVAWREDVSRVKRAAFADQEYWGRPVPGFGDPEAWLLVVGLAPAAHGANRTGRMFTGDRSGDWLYRALHKARVASQASSAARDDGLELHGAYVTAAVRCAPPGNRPKSAERDNCSEYLERELDLLARVRVVVALGGFAYEGILRVLGDRGHEVPVPRPPFAHGCEVPLGGELTVIASYHPSQQNTFTKRLTEPMFDRIWRRALELGPAA